jgi:hypothetical protein
MNKISLRFGFNRFWNNFYYPKFFLDNEFPIPFWSHIQQDLTIKKIILGFFPSHNLHILKYRDIINIYITLDKFVTFDILKSLRLKRILFNIFKCKILINKLYTFPIDDVHLIIGYLLKDHKEKLEKFHQLWANGKILGIKIKIKGRYKKSTRTQYDIFQFGQIPNTPTTKIDAQLFYSSYQLLQSLGTSSLHIYIYYP